MKRSQLLALEAEVAGLEEEFAAAKAKRKHCGECGSLKKDPKIEAQISKIRDRLHEKRAAFREARAKFDG